MYVYTLFHKVVYVFGLHYHIEQMLVNLSELIGLRIIYIVGNGEEYLGI